MQRSIIHPRKRAARGNFYPDHITIQQLSGGVTNGRGVPVGATWMPLEGHIDLPVHIVGQGGTAVPGNGQGETVLATHRLLLQGYFPAITEKHRAVDGAGNIYNILLATSDAMKSYSILHASRTTG